MRKLTGLFVVCFLLSTNTLLADGSDEVIKVEENTEITAKKETAATSDGYKKFRFGGYGEMAASFKDYGNNRFYGGNNGNSKDNRNTISIPRFVLAFDYKFNSKWMLGAEIEFEAGGVGTAYEIENSENGEYETEV